MRAMTIIGLSVLIGFAVPIALIPQGANYRLAFLVGVSALALLGLTMRWPFVPLLVYWGVYSFSSVFQLSTWRILAGSVPITVPDAIMLLMAFAVGIQWLRKAPANGVALPTRLSLGMVVVLAYGLLSAGLGALHGYTVYAIAIDLRSLSYLVVGYAAARLTLPAWDRQRWLALLFVVGLVGLLFEQGLVTLDEFARLPGLRASIAVLRDIGAPYYLGKYGIFLMLLIPARSAWMRFASLGGVVAGLAAIAATFIRTAWLEVAAGLIVVLVLGGWRSARKTLLALGVAIIIAGLLLSLGSAVSTIAAGAQSRLEFSPSTLFDDPTVAGRLQESRSALSNLADAKDWTLGVGLGMSVNDALHPNQHNSYVWVLSKQGLVGLALFTLVVVVAPLVVGLRAVMSTGGLCRAVLVCLLTAHVANVVGGYTSGNLTFSPYSPLLGMSIAWLVDIGATARHARPVDIPLSSQGGRQLPPSWAGAERNRTI